MELKPIRTDGQPAGPVRYTPSGDALVAEQGQKVLRNTYLLLALTMVPTVIGAYIGMATAAIVFAHPIATSLGMLAVVIGLQFGIAAHRGSGAGGAALPLWGWAARAG